MSIAKEINAFLEVSERFLRETASGVMSDGWPSFDRWNVAGSAANHGNGNPGGNAMPAYRQDGA